MDYAKTCRRRPHHPSIRFCQNAGNVAQPFHDLARFNRDFRNAIL
jgi:hypothetical protein